MALSPQERKQLREALNRLSATARDAFLERWRVLGDSDRLALLDAWVAVVGSYGDLSAELGVLAFESQAATLGITPRLDVAPGVDAARAQARLGWAMASADRLGNVAVLIDELVKQPFRSTLQDSAVRSGVGWARVPTGAETCKFCLLLASRGGVYGSSQIAEFGLSGKKYHGDCDCEPVVVRSPDDYPAEYDPGALYERYALARDSAQSDDIHSILSAWRQIEP